METSINWKFLLQNLSLKNYYKRWRVDQCQITEYAEV